MKIMMLVPLWQMRKNPPLEQDIWILSTMPCVNGLKESVDKTVNMTDHFTKQLGTTLFHRHVDYIMGHIPPNYTVHFQKLLGLSQIAPPDQVSHPTIAAKICQLWTQTICHHTSILSNPILA
jgi:hypothetical protein